VKIVSGGSIKMLASSPGDLLLLYATSEVNVCRGLKKIQKILREYLYVYFMLKKW